MVQNVFSVLRLVTGIKTSTAEPWQTPGGSTGISMAKFGLSAVVPPFSPGTALRTPEQWAGGLSTQNIKICLFRGILFEHRSAGGGRWPATDLPVSKTWVKLQLITAIFVREPTARIYFSIWVFLKLVANDTTSRNVKKMCCNFLQLHSRKKHSLTSS